MGVNSVFAVTELGLYFKMKTLLVIAMFSAVKANPAFVYTVGNTPLIYTNGHGHGYNGPIEEPVQPLQYVRPPLYANNACRNNLGELVPCAFPSSAGASVYAYNNYPQINFFDFTGGLAAPVAPVAPAAPVVEGYYPIEKAEVPAPEEIENSLDDEGVVSLKKREANAEPQAQGYYGGRGYYAARPANIKDIDYGKTEIKYNVKREAEADPEAQYFSYPVYSDYSTGYHFGAPYYGGYYRGYGCRNGYGSIVPCAETGFA